MDYRVVDHAAFTAWLADQPLDIQGALCGISDPPVTLYHDASNALVGRVIHHSRMPGNAPDEYHILATPPKALRVPCYEPLGPVPKDHCAILAYHARVDGSVFAIRHPHGKPYMPLYVNGLPRPIAALPPPEHTRAGDVEARPAGTSRAELSTPLRMSTEAATELSEPWPTEGSIVEELSVDSAVVIALRVRDLRKRHNGDTAAVAVDLLLQLDAAIGVLRDYPTGQDDGSWLKRRDNAIVLAQKTGAVP